MRIRYAEWFISIACWFPAPALADAVDLFSEPAQSPLPQDASPPPVNIDSPTAPPPSFPLCAPSPSSGETLTISEIQITGNTILQPEIEQIRTTCLQQFQQTPIPVEQLAAQTQTVADAITQLYLNAGYLTTRAIVNDTDPNDHLLQIQVYEGQLPAENIQITWADGKSRPRLEGYARRRILLGTGVPLRLSHLEDQLRLLKVDPLFQETEGGNVEASLKLSGLPGQSILVVTLTPADPFQGSVSLDNYSPPAVGSEQVSFSLSYTDLIGTGDSIAAAYNHSFTNGLNVIGLNYRLPVNPKDGAVQLGASFDFTRVTDPEFDELNIQGENQYYELGFRQPLIRTPREELALGLSFSYRNGQTFTFDREPTFFVEGVDADGISRTSVIHFTQEYINRDVAGAWAVRSQFNLGVDVLDATVNESPTPDGRFVSWLGQVQRSQLLNRRNILLAQADLQIAFDSLLPSDQFFAGGVQSVRGYRQNIRSGDNGLRLSLEDQIVIIANQAGKPQLQLIPFAEIGLVWNHPGNPNEVPPQNLLAGLGLGLAWEPLPDLNLRLDYGFPLVDLEDRGDNLQDQSLYLSVKYSF